MAARVGGHEFSSAAALRADTSDQRALCVQRDAVARPMPDDAPTIHTTRPCQSAIAGSAPSHVAFTAC